MDAVTLRLVIGGTEYVLSGWAATACAYVGVVLMVLGVMWLVEHLRSWRVSAEPRPQAVSNAMRYDSWYYSGPRNWDGTIGDNFIHNGDWTDTDKQRWREWRKRTKNFHMAEEPWRAGEIGTS